MKGYDHMSEHTPRYILNSLVPISRFNKGEATKIFEEVKDTGYKIVLKNNNPTCVLLSPEKYEQMLEIIEDYELYFEAENRDKIKQGKKNLSHNEVLDKFDINEIDLTNINVELE